MMMRRWVWVAVVLLPAGCGRTEPAVQGKPMSQWAKRLSDKDPAVRRGAAEALGQAGPAAQQAIPELQAALTDEDGGVRRAAADALDRIGPDAVAAVPALIDALKDKDPEVRSQAALALSDIVPDHERVAPPLILALKDPDRNVRKTVVVALGRLGPKNRDVVVGALTNLLKAKDEHPEVRSLAQETLQKIDPNARP